MKRPCRAWLLGAWLASLSGCSSPPVCPAENEVAGACAGVPADAVCEADACVTGVSCESTVVVSEASALAAAAASAKAGTCLALAPGSYPAVVLPGGVHLLGKGAAYVTVGGVEVSGGTGTVLRGVTVGSGGIDLDGALDAMIASVHVSGSAGVGITLANGASATISASTISSSSGAGVDALGASGLWLTGAVIAGSGGPGVWVECAAGCACDDTEKPEVVMVGSVVHGASYMGVALVGATATLTDVRIADTEASNFELGGGLSIMACSDVTATGVEVVDNADFGILIDSSAATLGAAGEGNGLVVSGNLRGIWAQAISVEEPQEVHVENATLSNNRGVGLGIGGDTVGFIICKSAISDTQMHSLPLDVGGADDIGDGLLWTAGSQAVLEDVTLSGSARASLLIDGEVGANSTLKGITLSGGDAAKGIVHQNLPAGGVEPQAQSGVPAIQKLPGGMYSVAAPPVAPSSP